MTLKVSPAEARRLLAKGLVKAADAVLPGVKPKSRKTPTVVIGDGMTDGEREFLTQWQVIPWYLEGRTTRIDSGNGFPEFQYFIPEDVRNQGAKPHGYRADFCWPEFKVIFESAGGCHATRDEWQRDMARDNTLTAWGYSILKASPKQIRDNPQKVIEAIRKTLEWRVK